MAGKQPNVFLETQLEEAERKGREEGDKKGMADLFAALSAANSGDRRVAVVDHQQRDGQPYYQARLDLSAAMLNADKQRHTEVVLFLIGADIKTCYANLNLNGHTILHGAVENGQTELVEAYLKAGADPNFTKDEYETPLACAVNMGHTEIVKALVAAGADLNNGTEPEGAEWLIDYEFQGDHAEMTRILLEAGAYFGPNRRDSWTPLMSACRHGKTKSADLLIKAGSDVNAANADGETALIVAPCADRGSVIDTICLC